MKIFLSHASRDKPLVREIVSHLPESLTIWIDEKDLSLGSEISSALEDTITYESDLVILFISPEAVSSQWVKKELYWALKREKEIGHIFIFPIVLDSVSWDKVEPIEFQKRKYLKLNDFTTESSKNLANKLEREIFDWLVKQKSNSVTVPSRLKEFELEIKIKAGNLIRKSELLNDGNISNNEGVIAVFKTDFNDSRQKNSLGSGLPFIGVEITNKGADIEIDSVELQFNKSNDSNDNKTTDDGRINPKTIASINLCDSFPQKGNKHIKSNHKESYGNHWKIVMEQIFLRGIQNIIVTDVIGNTYTPNKNEIKEAEKYLNTFFEYEGLDKLYEYYES